MASCEFSMSSMRLTCTWTILVIVPPIRSKMTVAIIGLPDAISAIRKMASPVRQHHPPDAKSRFVQRSDKTVARFSPESHERIAFRAMTDVKRQSQLNYPTWPDRELDCGPICIRRHDTAVEHWATLVDALASGAIEPTRAVSLTSDARSDLRLLHVDCRLDGRHLHIAFEPKLIPDRYHHAG